MPADVSKMPCVKTMRGTARMFRDKQFSNFSQAKMERRALWDSLAQPQSLEVRNMTRSPSAPFIDALHSSGQAPDRADKMGLYGWLIGDWEMDSVIHKEDC